MATPKKIVIQDLELADKEIARLRKENKELKNELMEDMKYEEKLEKENKELKRENKNLLYEIKCGYENRKEIDKRMLELEEENEELKEELEKFKTDIIYEEGLYE